MIPILYEANETEFTSNGLGRLADAISCVVKEEVNNKYELEMEYVGTGIHYEDLQEGRIIYATHDDEGDAQPFRIYKITRPINNRVKVYGEHISYLLNKEIVLPCEADNVITALQTLKENSIECPFEFTTDKQTSANWSIAKPMSLRSALGGVEGSILDVYGGEFLWDKWDVQLCNNRGADNGVTLRYGKNIKDLTHNIDISSVHTACVPYWTSEATGTIYVEGNPVVKSAFYDLFPYGLTVPLDLTETLKGEDGYIPTNDELIASANAYLNSKMPWIQKESIAVSFVPLYQTMEYENVAVLQRVNLCDWVTVEYPELGVSVKLKVTATDYNVLADRYDKVTLGQATSSLHSTITSNVEKEVTQKTSILEAQMEKAIEGILGGLGGYMVINRNANGQPNELLFLDEPNLNDAVHVLRLNKNGIAFSKTGYNGTFTSAWTLEGDFVADFITAGTMYADRIKGGTLKIGGENDQNGVIHLYDGEGSKICEIDQQGVTIYAKATGDYVRMNGEDGFVGYNAENTRIYWASNDTFHMRNAEVEKNISIAGKIKLVPVDTENNTGVGFVAISN